MLKELPPTKIEIIPDDPTDQEVADQMTKLINYMDKKCVNAAEEIVK